MTTERLRAPFPAFGGKSRIAHEVWRRFGNPAHYVEPFAFSAAVLLARPQPGKYETINDINAYVANFWRAVAHDPDAVAHHADWPINEADKRARHLWLLRSEEATTHLAQVADDPDFYDAKIAGWWCWGQSIHIAGGWCDPISPSIGSRPKAGLSGIATARSHDDVVAWMRKLSDRLRRVRVLCGHWKRTCGSASALLHSGDAAVFLDPPYRLVLPDGSRNRNRVYATDRASDVGSLCDEVEDWCLRWGANPAVRIALCGFEGEYPRIEAAGWSMWSWKTAGGYAKLAKRANAPGKANARRERIWFSPACVVSSDLCCAA